jgi:hypothetical protein
VKPGRLPQDNPEEQKARDKLRELSPEARRKVIQEREDTTIPASLDTPAPVPSTPPQRWS